MTEETASELASAQTALEAASATVERKKAELLSAIAAGLPERAVAIGRSATERMPDVARRLGRDGINRLRNDLQELGSQLGSDLSSGKSKVSWPGGEGLFTTFDRDIEGALYQWSKNYALPRLKECLGRFGLRAPDLIVEWRAFYDGESPFFGEVAQAFSQLSEAATAWDRAKQADDQSDVNLLWADDH